MLYIHLLGFFLELLNGSLVDATTFVDQMTGGRRLARIDVSNDDNVYVCLLSSHLSRKQKPCPEIKNL